MLVTPLPIITLVILSLYENQGAIEEIDHSGFQFAMSPVPLIVKMPLFKFHVRLPPHVPFWAKIVPAPAKINKRKRKIFFIVLIFTINIHVPIPHNTLCVYEKKCNHMYY